MKSGRQDIAVKIGEHCLDPRGSEFNSQGSPARSDYFFLTHKRNPSYTVIEALTVVL